MTIKLSCDNMLIGSNELGAHHYTPLLHDMKHKYAAIFQKIYDAIFSFWSNFMLKYSPATSQTPKTWRNWSYVGILFPSQTPVMVTQNIIRLHTGLKLRISSRAGIGGGSCYSNIMKKKTVKKHIFTDNKSLIYDKKLLNETNDNIFIIIKMIWCFLSFSANFWIVKVIVTNFRLV